MAIQCVTFGVFKHILDCFDLGFVERSAQELGTITVLAIHGTATRHGEVSIGLRGGAWVWVGRVEIHDAFNVLLGGIAGVFLCFCDFLTIELNLVNLSAVSSQSTCLVRIIDGGESKATLAIETITFVVFIFNVHEGSIALTKAF